MGTDDNDVEQFHRKPRERLHTHLWTGEEEATWPMTMNSSDAVLVAGHLAGDPAALAAIYDRYSDPLHDTAAAMLNDRSEAADVLHDVILIAAERLDQLREPDRLKPWLFAILRNEVYRRSKTRRRTIATDFSGSDDGWDMADDRHLDPAVDVTDDAAGDDLTELVRNAARGLDERDQMVLEFSVRQGLDGQDLADALGVSANQSYTLVHRMRERVERSLTAYVVAKAGRNDCNELDSLLSKWDGEFTVLVRKRVARHVDSCEVCDTRRSKAAPLALFAAAPVYAAPDSLRDHVLSGVAARAATPQTPYRFTAADGFPQVVRMAHPVAAWVAKAAAASLILVVIGLGVMLIDRGNNDVIHDSAFATATSPTTTPPTTEAVTDDDAAVAAPIPAAGAASNDAVPDITTTAPVTIPAGSIPAKERPTTTTPPTIRPATTRPTAPATPSPRPTPTPASPTPQPGPTESPPAAPTTPAPTTAAPTTAAPAAGRLSVGGGSIDLGSGSSSGSVTISNTGDLPIDFAVGGNPGPFSISTTAGTLAGGGSTQFSASLDRTGLAEGSGPGGSVQITGGGESFNVDLSAQVNRDPVISGASASSYCSSTSAGISGSAGISDESSVTATFVVSGPGGQSASSAMGPDGSTWYGSVNLPFSGPNSDDSSNVNGTWSWSITATDSRGNRSSAGGSTTVSCSPTW